MLLGELTVDPEVYISHLKPGLGDDLMKQVEALGSALHLQRLVRGKVIEF
jgi:3',5'-cyclic-nucleotide phosphodiesterase